MPGHDHQHAWTATDAKKLLLRSLGERVGLDPLQAVVGVVALVLPIIGSWLIFHHDSRLIDIGTAAVMLPLIIIALTTTARVRAAIARRTLRRVGHGFDAAKFLGLLALPHQDARLVVRLRLASAWPDERRIEAIDRLRTSVSTLKTVELEAKDHVLRLETTELTTRDSVMSHSQVTRFYTNRPLYECLVTILHKVVPAITATCTIQKIEAEVVGKVASGEA